LHIPDYIYFFIASLMFPGKRGFTLIELLVVISIIGVLSTIAMTSLNAARIKARDAKRITEIEQIQKALEVYYSVHGYYPGYTNIGIRCNTTSGTSSLASLVTDGSFSVAPKDPLNTSSPLPRFCYEYVGLGSAVNYSSSSVWYCDGHSRTDYLYSFLFSTEVISANFSRLTNPSGTPLSDYKYCIHGDLR